jgi:hypothetical protein
MRLGLLLPLLVLSAMLKAQILFDMGQYRNLGYTSYGFNNDFENVTIGVARRDYIHKIKREIVGLLDVSLPLSDHFLTRHAVRKGFQIEAWKKNEYKIQFMFASSSVVREIPFYKWHDVTAEFSLVPGIYRPKYTIALDLRCEIIALRYRKCLSDSVKDADPTAKKRWDEPFYPVGKAGIMFGLNFKRMVFYVKTGYERKPTPSNPLIISKTLPAYFLNIIPAYFVFGFGYKFGTKPFSQPKTNTFPEKAQPK